MGFLYSQLFVTPALPTTKLTGQTVIVTGSNVGLGLEGARHLTNLGAAKVILAVRNTQAGEEAKTSIEKSTKRTGVVEVWNLDLSSYENVKAFAAKASKLERLDVLLENAGVATQTFKLAEGEETTITINVISTFLLALLLLPKLQETATRFNTRPRLTIVSSEVHAWSKFTDRNASNILATISDEKKADMNDRYQLSKLLEVLVIREIAPKIAAGKNKDVILNMLNPGLCHSSLSRESSWMLSVLKFFLARTTELGGRTLVASAVAGPESHGAYMTDGVVDNDAVAEWVRADEGEKVGKQVWAEVKAKLEQIAPGVTKNIE